MANFDSVGAHPIPWGPAVTDSGTSASSAVRPPAQPQQSEQPQPHPSEQPQPPTDPLPPAEAAYYAAHSSFSDPGAMVHLYADLPRDVGELARVVRGLMIHRVEGEQWGAAIDEHRMHHDAEARYVDVILRLLAERAPQAGSAPLAGAARRPRPYGDRFVGICRDFTLLHVSLLRHLGIPARLRVGFVDYFDPGHADDPDRFHFDHVLTEYWDDRRGWLLADPQIADPERYAPQSLGFDPADVPRERFWSAGRAWQAIRAGDADPARFGLPPVGGEFTGQWFVAGDVRLDIAALNKTETLLWDVWGASADLGPGRPVPDGLLPLFDRAARISADPDPYQAARELFATCDDLRTPRAVTSYTRFTGNPEVTLRTPPA